MAQLLQKQTAPHSSSVTPTPSDATELFSGPDRIHIFIHALSFVLGFTLVFALLGVVAGIAGAVVSQVLQKVGAVVLLLLALTMLGVFRRLAEWLRAHSDTEHNLLAAILVSIFDFINGLLYSERRLLEMHQVNQRWGYLSSAVVGIGFGAGWTPCIGPILGSIWFLASDTSNIGSAMFLMALYSLGLGIPFLIAGAAFSSTTQFLRRLNRHTNIVATVSAFLLIAIAVLLWTGDLNRVIGTVPYLSQFALGLEEFTIGIEMATSNALGIHDILSVGVLSAAPIALIAGLVSFFSPCVLPLVPAYLGYLSGAATSGSSR